MSLDSLVGPGSVVPPCGCDTRPPPAARRLPPAACHPPPATRHLYLHPTDSLPRALAEGTAATPTGIANSAPRATKGTERKRRGEKMNQKKKKKGALPSLAGPDCTAGRHAA